MMFATCFEYYTIILRGGALFCGHAVEGCPPIFYYTRQCMPPNSGSAPHVVIVNGLCVLFATIEYDDKTSVGPRWKFITSCFSMAFTSILPLPHARAHYGKT